ncbi:hypothetical protein ONE63_010325 [Megalurothrips usitatus]|uniref:DUF4806 domain-containing protein n=1 Tax=Megalurothrips usitatus TaxID=439358 RepID=A0AAV7XJ52_9NEOP|nr:hypothetical protein ONE63_010325 [Megalurothrips usitatus]
MREKKLAMIPKRTRYNYVRQRMLALILEAQEEELQNSLQQVEAPETYLDADETGSAAIDVHETMGFEGLSDMVRELTMHMRKLRAQIAVQSSKTVVPGFKLPLANPDEVVKLDRVLSEKPALAKGLKKYLTGLGLEGDGTVRVVGKVMGGILSDYAGYFLNFQGIKTGDRVVNSATQRIGLKKVAPFVHDAIESAYAEVAKELKNAAVSDLRAKTVTWFSKRKAPQRGTDAEGNEDQSTSFAALYKAVCGLKQGASSWNLKADLKGEGRPEFFPTNTSDTSKAQQESGKSKLLKETTGQGLHPRTHQFGPFVNGFNAS